MPFFKRGRQSLNGAKAFNTPIIFWQFKDSIRWLKQPRLSCYPVIRTGDLVLRRWSHQLHRMDSQGPTWHRMALSSASEPPVRQNSPTELSTPDLSADALNPRADQHILTPPCQYCHIRIGYWFLFQVLRVWMSQCWVKPTGLPCQCLKLVGSHFIS